MSYCTIKPKIYIATLFLLFSGFIGNAQTTAFPNAEGYGHFASGGRGDGETAFVIAVTTLEDDPSNPVTNQVNIQSKESIQKIEIFDLFGKLVYSKNLKQNNDQIKTDTFNNGIHFIKAYYAGNKSDTYTFIKQ